MPKFTKVERGWYATEDGTLAVVHDGYGYINATGRMYGDGNDGWSLASDPQGRLREDHNAGDNLDWFSTKREAVAAANRLGR